jgi:putative hydrolase of the HAD superfamily
MKLKKTELGRYFHAAITSCEIGYPKEMLEFWKKAEKHLGFEKEKTLFIDDTVAVLRAAALYGIKHILHKTYASSKGAKGVPEDFPAIEDFRELMFLDDFQE